MTQSANSPPLCRRFPSGCRSKLQTRALVEHFAWQAANQHFDEAHFALVNTFAFRAFLAITTFLFVPSVFKESSSCQKRGQTSAKMRSFKIATEERALKF